MVPSFLNMPARLEATLGMLLSRFVTGTSTTALRFLSSTLQEGSSGISSTSLRRRAR